MTRTYRLYTGIALVGLGFLLTGGAAQGSNVCLEPDNGTGTVTLPPLGCDYLSPDQVHMIIDGLPPGTTVILDPIHERFICQTGGGSCGTPGGSLGGRVENFTSTGTFRLSGTGALAGWSRIVSVPLTVETHTAPRTLGASVQSFNTNMRRIQGQITGDPDFALFEVVGGTANGYPSPGQTTLTRQGSSSIFLVNSTFRVGYRIRFVGATGGRLASYSGTTTSTVNMSAVQDGNIPCP